MEVAAGVAGQDDERRYYSDEELQPVALAPLDDDDEPNTGGELTTASQYLRSVMRESRAMPSMFVAAAASPTTVGSKRPSVSNSRDGVGEGSPPDVAQRKRECTQQLPAGPTLRLFKQVANSPSHATPTPESCPHRPSEQWQVTQLTEFFTLHQYVDGLKQKSRDSDDRGPNLPRADNEFIWCCELYGRQMALRVVCLERIPKSLRTRDWYRKLKLELEAQRKTPQPEECPDDSVIEEADTEDDANEVEGGEPPEDEELDEEVQIINERMEQVVENVIPVRQPVLSFAIFLPQRTVEKLLSWHIEWFGEDESPITYTTGLWLYTLLVVLEKPVKPDCVFTLRQICRLARTQRDSITSSPHFLDRQSRDTSTDDGAPHEQSPCNSSEVPHPTSENDPEKVLPALNLLILIITRYFDQHDLAD